MDVKHTVFYAGQINNNCSTRWPGSSLVTVRNPETKRWKASVLDQSKDEVLLSSEGITLELALADLHEQSAEAAWGTIEGLTAGSDGDNESTSASTVSDMDEWKEGDEANRPWSRTPSGSSDAAPRLDIANEQGRGQLAFNTGPVSRLASSLSNPAAQMPHAHNVPRFRNVMISICWDGHGQSETVVYTMPNKPSLCHHAKEHVLSHKSDFRTGQRDYAAMKAILVCTVQYVIVSGQKIHVEKANNNLDMWFRDNQAPKFVVNVGTVSSAVLRGVQDPGRTATKALVGGPAPVEK
ncbi:hypothetical protein NKR19_g5835 [Coniochaeta hoffmannii]|uniref:Uncharacterized protein n=1 Tax=Coniochaeta hoffmannii TaxID=91930 RepID=A0AA38VRM4_9PEZI|nr:hypothetical protein NKR19_g5835 [Coniochaeta hoffmannii]